MKPAADPLEGYRPNIGIVLFARDGRVFFGRRAGDFADIAPDAAPGAWRWQFPQGGVDAGEGFAAAALRELREETGVVSARLLALSPGWAAYDFPPSLGKRWRGQKQKWAALLFEGAETEIDLEADESPEFDAWRWGDLEEAPGLVVPFKRAVYEDVAAAFAPLRDAVRRGFG